MAYNGYLIKLGGSAGDVLPIKYMAIGSYKSTPNQRMEANATRAVTGVLHRTTVEHKATKIEFNTPVMTNTDIVALNNLIGSHFTNVLEKKLTINYYDQETDSYRDAVCYMPDIDYTISRIDKATNTIYYEGIRYAFIEY